MEISKESALRDFQQIPGVGKAVANDLWNLGLRSSQELRNEDPENLYNRLCTYQGVKVDRCMLYTFRCAVYFVSNDQHDPERLKWWNWTDEKLKTYQMQTR